MKDQGTVVVPQGSSLAIRIENITVRPEVGFYQNGDLIHKSDDPADLEMALDFSDKPTEIHWLVMVAEIPEHLPEEGWTYDVVILADGVETKRFSNTVPGESNSFQKCEIVPEGWEEGGDTDDQ